MLAPWAPLVWSLVLLTAVWLTGRKLSSYFLGVVYLLTRSRNAALGLYVILLLPGTVVHELSHWLMAKLVGVRTGRIAVFPSRGRHGNDSLGFVTVRGGALWQHTLIGLAPLLVGSLLTFWLTTALFDVPALQQAWLARRWADIGVVLIAGLRRPDAWPGLYLLFALSHAMFLSAPDRAPVQRMLVYLAAVLTVLYALGWMPTIPPEWTTALQGAFAAFAAGLTVTFGLHLAGLAVVWSLFHLVRRLVR
jgi:hypothetical protein